MKQLSQWITVILLGVIFVAVGLILIVAQSDGEPVVIVQETQESGVQSLVPTSDPAVVEFAPTAIVPATEVTNFQTYVVGPGDTLADIAARFGTTWQEIDEINDLANPNSLDVGQELRIPSEQ